MERRRLLAMAALGVGSLTGCIADGTAPQSTEPSNDTETPTATPTDDDVVIPTPTGRCGTAAVPQSAQFVDDGGGSPACFEGAEPSLAIENEREDEITVDLELAPESGDETMFEARYTLASGERVVEQRTLVAQKDYTARVTLGDGETATGSWTGTSCYRHGISLTPDGVSFGLVPPLSGPGDTQHDCFAGDAATISLRSEAVAQTVTVHVVDHCEEAVVDETITVAADGVERLDDVIENGGLYDVIFAVDDGGVETFEFDNQCWGISAAVDENGNVTAHQTLID